MKSSTPELRALLATRRFAMADLYEITTTRGETLRYCGADKTLAWDGHTWDARGPIISRGATRLVRGVEADTLKVTLSPRTTESLLLQQARGGLFDSARLTLYRAFMPDWQSPVTGVVHRFSGTVNDVETSRAEVVLNIKSVLQLLDRKVPGALYNPGCPYTLFDAGCGLLAGDFEVATTVQGSSTVSTLDVAATVTAGQYDLGTVLLVTGINAGESRSIRQTSAPGRLALTYPLPQTPAAGDQVVLLPGCDGCVATCRDRYNNLTRYGGTPYVPSPETAH